MTGVAKRFEHLREHYRRSDGSMWGGQDLDKATGGVVSRSYVTNLRKGRIVNPGYDKLAAIAKAMGFSPRLWFEDLEQSDAVDNSETAHNPRSLADRINHLFDATRAETGEPYTNTEIARMSTGDISEEEVEGMRMGSITNPSIDRVVALADAFGIHPSYFLERGSSLPVIDREMLDIFRDETVSAIAHKSLHLPDREKQTILGIIRQFEQLHDSDRDNRS